MVCKQPVAAQRWLGMWHLDFCFCIPLLPARRTRAASPLHHRWPESGCSPGTGTGDLYRTPVFGWLASTAALPTAHERRGTRAARAEMVACAMTSAMQDGTRTLSNAATPTGYTTPLHCASPPVLLFSVPPYFRCR